jgi:hypothetical protein
LFFTIFSITEHGGFVMEIQKLESITPDSIVAGRPCYTRQTLARALGKSQQTIAGWKTKGFGPPYFLVGRRVLYPEDHLIEWLNTRLVKPEAYIKAADEM